jgi:hypothetical protein
MVTSADAAGVKVRDRVVRVLDEEMARLHEAAVQGEVRPGPAARVIDHMLDARALAAESLVGGDE